MNNKGNKTNKDNVAKNSEQEQMELNTLEQKICSLRNHCDRIKDALTTVVGGGEKDTSKVARAKRICKKSVEDYDDEYEALRCLCNDEIENLEPKVNEIYQYLLSMEIEG